MFIHVYHERVGVTKCKDRLLGQRCKQMKRAQRRTTCRQEEEQQYTTRESLAGSSVQPVKISARATFCMKVLSTVSSRWYCTSTSFTLISRLSADCTVARFARNNFSSCLILISCLFSFFTLLCSCVPTPRLIARRYCCLSYRLNCMCKLEMTRKTSQSYI